MKVFKGLFGTIFASFALFMLFVMLVRLVSGKEQYIGISDIWLYFEGVDFLKPFKEFMANLSYNYEQLMTSTRAFSSISSLQQFIKVVGNFIPSLFNLLVSPIALIYYLCKWLVVQWLFIFDFFVTICGWSPIS